MNAIETTAGDMMAELVAAGPLFSPSAFWHALNEDNRRMLVEEGLANFKRTVSNNYFNWLITDHKSALFRHAFRQWLRRPDLLPMLTRLGETRHLRVNTAEGLIRLNAIQRHTYRLYVCFIWTIMKELDRHSLRSKVTEPHVGNPLPVMLGTKLLSQDLATSIIECNVLADSVQNVVSPRVAELGAGYGRLAHVYATTLPGQYFIFDIPPALSVAQWYLKQTLGPKRLFEFRRFDRFDDMFKTWKNPNDGTELSSENYRFASDWSLILDRTDPVIPDFFNRVWQRNANFVAALHS